MLTSRKGFTLVELLVVLLILSLLLAAVPIAYQRVLPGLELRSETREIARIFREARALAIQENRDMAVSIDVEERSLRTTGNGTVHRILEGVIVTLEAASSEQIGENAAQIRFFPNGASTGGRITLDRLGNRYHIEVDWLYGRVRIIQ